MKIYHITKQEYVPAIMVQGLIINSGFRGLGNQPSVSCYKKPLQPLFLTHDLKFIVNSMLTESWIRKNLPVVMEIQVELTPSNSDMGKGLYLVTQDNQIKALQIEYYNNIPANLIEFRVDLRRKFFPKIF